MTQTERRTSGSPAAVLAAVRDARAAERAAAARILAGAAEWASMHVTFDGDEAAGWWTSGGMVSLAGEGAPLVAEFAIGEFAAALGVSTDSGRRLIGDALELAHRLPKTWQGVQSLQVPAWQGRRIAQQTTALPPEAAAFVDTHVAAVAGRVGPAQLDRLIIEARHRFVPEGPVEGRPDPDTRHATLHRDDVTFAGTVRFDAELDLPDALDLDRALAATAAQLRDLGSAESLDARRATALGQIARNQLTLGDNRGDNSARDDSATDEHREPDQHPAPAARPVTLYLHLHQRGLDNADDAHSTGGVGRCENTRSPIDAETIRAWCGNPDATLTVRPVLDLDQHVHTDAYEVPDRLRSQTDLRDLHCVFPWCTRPAARCDHDHGIAHTAGGTTCTCNLAPLCRRHHRLKTLTPWQYKMPEPGVYLWTSPHRYRFLRNHLGTVDVTPEHFAPATSCASRLPDHAGGADP